MANLSTTTDLTINILSQEKYDQLKLSGLLEPYQLYFTDNVLLDAEGQQIQNVGSPILSSDAATKGYVDSKVSSIHVPTDLSAFSNSPGYLTKTSADSIFQPIGNYLLSDDVSISYSNKTIWLSSKAYVTSVDCTDFIKDGMLSTVQLCGTTLVMNFNTDAGSDPISVELSNFVDNYDEKINDLSDHIDKKIFVSDSISGISGYSDLSVIKLDASEYSNLLTSNSLLSNALYIVNDDYMDAYGQQIKNVALPTDLSDAANKEYVDQQISSIVIPTDLSDFTNSPKYVTESQVSNVLSVLDEKIDNKVFIDNHISGISAYSDLNVIRLSSAEYADLLNQDKLLSNAIYIVEDSFKNAYGRQLKNLADPTDLSDAANKEYVDNAVSSIQIPTDLSAFTNSPGYLVEHQSLSDYYQKSETSSAQEISTAIESIDVGNKVFVDDRISGIHEQVDLSIIHLSSSEYEQLSAAGQILSNALYIVEDSFTNNYGKQIKNVAEPSLSSDAATKNYVDQTVDKKIFIDDQISGISGYSDLSVVKLDSETYSTLLTSGSLLSNALYVVQDDYMDAYGQQVKNIARGTDLSDAVTVEQLSDAISQIPTPTDLSSFTNSPGYATEDSIVPAIFNTVQLIKPKQSEGYRLHFRGDIARDDQFSDIVISGFDSSTASNYQYFKHFAVDGTSGVWETMLSNGFYSDADDVPSYFKLADALSSIGETPSLSSQYFLRYIWHYELSGVEHRSDQFSIAVPSNTAVGANPGDVIHKDEFYSLKQSVEPQKQRVDLDEDYSQYYICKSTKITEISNEVAGEFDVLLDGYEASKTYRMQFAVSELSDATPKFYIDYGNGPEFAAELSVNIDSYAFKAGKRYYAELQNDILKVDTFGYSGDSGGGGQPSPSLPSRYKLVTAQLSSISNSLCCTIEDHTITTVQISSSSIPVVIKLPPKADDGARDFMLRVEISSSTAPGFTFEGIDEQFTFDTDDDDWAILEPGVNLISFTETR